MSLSDHQFKPCLPPAELRPLKAWLIWKFEQYPGETKPRKIPYYISGGKRYGHQGSDRDRESLTTFAAARDAAAKRGFDGVGFAPMPEFGIVALDFDRCVAADGSIPDEVRDVVAGTYSELSPSGLGIRAFMRGNLGNRKSGASPDQFGFETFSSSGFVTVTGNILPGVELLGLENTVASVNPATEALANRRFGENRQVQGVAGDDPFAGTEKPMGLSFNEMEALLQKLDPDMDRDSWIRVGMALHFETSGDDTGFEIFNEWSAKGGKYPSSEALKAQWESFDRPKRSGQRPITMATVLRLVKQANQGDPGRLAGEASAGSATSELPLLIDRDIANTTSTGYKRRPLVEGVAYLGELMNLSSAGGLGKSTYSSMLTIAVATGQNLLNAKVPHRRKALIVNGEDGLGEISMKLHAALIHQKIPEAAVQGQIFTFGAEDASIFCLIETDRFTKQVHVRPKALQALKDYIREKDIGLVILDPFVSFFPGDMNANGVVGSVMLALKRIAVETDCAIVIVQHVAKGTNAKTHGAEAASGAASTVNLARTAFGIMGIESAEAAKLGIMPGDEKNYFRLINTKNNLSIRSDDHLFRREAVPMGNGTEEFPDEDWVPVAIPYTAPEGGLSYPPQVLWDVLAALAKGTVDGLPFSPSSAKSSREFAPAITTTLRSHYPHLHSTAETLLAKSIVGKLKSDGWVTVAEVPIRKSTGGGGSNKGQALLVRWSMTPWATEPTPDRHVC